MITVLLNDKAIEITENCSLMDALRQWGYQAQLFAVAVNQQFVAKQNYATIVLSANDVIDIVSPMQGG